MDPFNLTLPLIWQLILSNLLFNPRSMRLQALSFYAMERLEEKRHNRSVTENGGRLQSCKTGISTKKHPVGDSKNYIRQ